MHQKPASTNDLDGDSRNNFRAPHNRDDRSIKQFFKQFIDGLFAPFSAIRLAVTHPSLFFLSIIPGSISFTLLFFAASHFSTKVKEWIPQFLNATWGFDQTSTLVQVATSITTFLFYLFSILVFSLVTTIIASPFNDFLAERTEAVVSISLPAEKKTLGYWARKQMRLVRIDVFKAVLAACMGIVALVFSFIPIINILAWLLTWCLVALQFLSYPQTRRELGIAASLFQAIRNPFQTLGFGISASLLLSIPFASGFFVPILVIAGTFVFSKFKRERI